MSLAKRTLASVDPNASQSLGSAQNASKRTKHEGKENEPKETLVQSLNLIDEIVRKYRVKAPTPQSGDIAPKTPESSNEDLVAFRNEITHALYPKGINSFDSTDIIPTIDLTTASNEAGTFADGHPQPANRGLKYITMARPIFDFRREHDEDELSEDLQKQYNADFRKYNRKPVNEFPEYKWTLSIIAEAIYINMDIAAQKCNPDMLGMYIYNDWEGYGLQEIIENTLVAWNTEFSKKEGRNPLKMWVHLEALAWFINETELAPWSMIDDGEKYCDTVCLLGITLLENLRLLDEANLLATWQSNVRNLPMVLSLWLTGLDEDESDWQRHLIAFADKAGIPIEGVHGIDKDLQKFTSSTTKLEKQATFVGKWKVFLSRHGHVIKGKKTIGGSKHDISKMTKSDRIRYSFDGKDPFAETGPPPGLETVPWGDI